MAAFETPILYSDENPDGVFLEDVIEQLLDELGKKQQSEPSRETALVMTNLEQALLWQMRRGMKRAGHRVEGTLTNRAGHTYVPRLIGQ